MWGLAALYKGMSTAVETAYVGVRFGEETNLTLCGTGGELLGRDAEPLTLEHEGGSAGEVEPLFGFGGAGHDRRIVK